MQNPMAYLNLRVVNLESHETTEAQSMRSINRDQVPMHQQTATTTTTTITNIY